jgi:hypothetical protein
LSTIEENVIKSACRNKMSIVALNLSTCDMKYDSNFTVAT